MSAWNSTCWQEIDRVADLDADHNRALFEEAPIAYHELDSEGRICYVNQAERSLLGRRVENPIGRPAWDLLPPQDREASRLRVMHKLAGGEPRQGFEVNMQGHDGRMRTFALHETLVRDRAGKISGIRTALLDITDQRRAEVAFEKSEERFRIAAESVSDLIFEWDLVTGSLEFFWQSTNPKGSLPGNIGEIEKCIHPADQARVIAAARRHRGSHERFEEEFRLIGEDGTVAIWSVRARCLQAEEGQPIRSIVIAKDVTLTRQNEESQRILAQAVEQSPVTVIIANADGNKDVTERKRAEDAFKLAQQQLAQAQKLESIGQLAAGIAHEINTPIQYIGDNIRFLETSLEELSGVLRSCQSLASAESAPTHEDLQRLRQAAAAADLPYLIGEMPKAIAQIQEGVGHVANIVRAMREFSHPGSAERAVVDLNRLIENVITVSRNEWKYVADLTTDFDPGIPPVRCLPGEFSQVILNLIVNASHAIADALAERQEQKGAIAVRTLRDGDWVKVLVWDSGSGIPAPIRHRIFDPFFTTKDTGKGIGQGLAIAHDVVVNKHGGQITFETEVGAGTTFMIHMPLGGPGESA